MTTEQLPLVASDPTALTISVEQLRRVLPFASPALRMLIVTATELWRRPLTELLTVRLDDSRVADELRGLLGEDAMPG